MDTKMERANTLDSEPHLNQSLSRAQGLRALWRPFLQGPAAEFVGTMTLVIFGAGANCRNTLSGDPDVSSVLKGFFETGIIGWSAGAALGIWVFLDTSGGHIYPPVTLACALFRGFPWKKVPIYWLAQILGAFCGSRVVYAIYFSGINLFESGACTVPGTARLFATYPLPGMSTGFAFFSEVQCCSISPTARHPSHPSALLPFLTTAIFTIGVVTIAQKRKDPAPGSMIAFGIFLLFLGESAHLGMENSHCINPARDLGPILMTWIFYGKKVLTFNHYRLWSPIIAPLTGGAAGGAVYKILVHHDDVS